MSFFGINLKRTQKTIVTGGKIALRDRGTWSVTAASCYRRIAVASAQLEYVTARNTEQASMLSNVLATAIAAKIAYGVTIINIDSSDWKVLDNDRLEIVFDKDDRIIGFKYKNLASHDVQITNFLYSAHTSPGRFVIGALHDAAEDIKAENVTQAVAASLGENLSYIGLVAYVKGESDPRKLQAISDMISGAFTGDNRGGVLAISDNVKIESMLNITALNPIGTDNLRASRQAIAASFGVPYDLLYSDSSNRASVDAAKDLLYRDTIVPAAKGVVSDLGNTSLFGRIKLSDASLQLGQGTAQAEAGKPVEPVTQGEKKEIVEPAKPVAIKPIVNANEATKNLNPAIVL